MADIRTMNKPVVALGRDLMGSLFDLPKKAQKYATTFLTKFQTNPRSSGINLERIANAADEKLYSARIDQRYRAIIAFQKSSNVYVLLYVGDHDDAYKWAEKKTIDVNPNTRAIQLYETVSQEEIDAAMHEDSQNKVGWGSVAANAPQSDSAASESVPQPTEDYAGTNHGTASVIATPAVAAKTPKVPRQTPEPHTGPLPDTYRALTGNDMRRFGVPDMYVPVMCTRKTWEAFERWVSKLPKDAFTYLTFVAEGLPKSEVFGLLDETEGQTSDRLGLEQQMSASSIESGEEPDPGGLSCRSIKLCIAAVFRGRAGRGGPQAHPGCTIGAVACVPASIAASLCGTRLPWSVPPARRCRYGKDRGGHASCEASCREIAEKRQPSEGTVHHILTQPCHRYRFESETHLHGGRIQHHRRG